MADIVAGSAMGVPFNALYDVIKDVVVTTKMFKPLVEELKAKMVALKPRIDEIDKYNEVLDRKEKDLKDFKKQMEKGALLIPKCSKVRWWNICKKYKYTNQLVGLQSSLQSLYELLIVQTTRDVQETLVEARDIGTVVHHTDTTVVEVAKNVQENLVTANNIETVVHRTDVTSLQVASDVRNIDTVVQRTDEMSLQIARDVRNIETVVQQIAENVVVHNQKTDLVHGWGAVPVGARVTVGVDEPLRELKIKLLKDEKVSMLVLTALGGCGKTTLAIKFCEDYEVKDVFKNNIFFVTVSKKSNLNLIVQGLHQRMGREVPTLEDEATAVEWLHKFMKEEGQAPILLVLDDVWPESKSLLENFYEVRKPNFKILVTSRSQFSGYGSVYPLRLLNDADAMTLFRDSASLGDGSSNVQWTKLATKIVERCKGHPLAIKVVGKSLRGQSFEFWKKREQELSKGDSIIDFETETEVLLCLQSSLDALDEKGAMIKECFLDLGLFPEDQRIPVAALIDMWAELHALDQDSLSVCHLKELTTRSLADLVVTRKDAVEDDEYYNEHFVTQHDLLRQLAVDQAKHDPSKRRLIIGNFGDNPSKWLREQNDQPIKPRLLSISSDGVFSTSLHNIELAEVEVLVLNFKTKEYALPEFVEKMDNLKVLIVTNHGFLPAELCNIQLLGSLSNLKRIRLERISISSITKNLVQLKSLKKISLFMCNIGQAFSNCSLQLSDALPYLEEMYMDYCNDLVELPAALCALVNLKKLSITNSHKLSALPKEIGNLVNLEVLRLRSCTDLTMLPGSSTNLKKLNFLDIADCFSIKELPEDFGGMSSLKNINMRQCSRLQELPSSVLDLEQLEEVVCDEDTGVLWQPVLPQLPNLQINLVEEHVNLNWL